MSWKKVTLSDHDISAGRDIALEDAFSAIFKAAGAPHGAAMYGNFDTISEGHHFFFSPAAMNIASQILGSYAAKDCYEPDIGILVPLVDNSTDEEPG